MRSALAAASHQLAEVLADGRQYADALERTRRARGLLEAALRENPLDAQHTRILLFVLNGESRYLWELGDRPGSLKVRARALEVAEEASRRDPQDRWSQMGVVVAAVALAEALLETGAARESVPHFREALRIGRAAAEADPQNRYVQLEAAAAEYGLGRARLAEGTAAARAEGCASLARVAAVLVRPARARARSRRGRRRTWGACPRCARPAADRAASRSADDAASFDDAQVAVDGHVS